MGKLCHLYPRGKSLRNVSLEGNKLKYNSPVKIEIKITKTVETIKRKNQLKPRPHLYAVKSQEAEKPAHSD